MRGSGSRVPAQRDGVPGFSGCISPPETLARGTEGAMCPGCSPGGPRWASEDGDLGQEGGQDALGWLRSCGTCLFSLQRPLGMPFPLSLQASLSWLMAALGLGTCLPRPVGGVS